MASSKVRKPNKKTVLKKDIEKIFELKKTELKKINEFLKRLKITVKQEETKISEIEGAILTLHTILTGEKVE